LWQSECNFPSEELGLSFKEKENWYSISLYETHGWIQEGVANEGGHFEDVADSLTNSVSTENLSWCRETIGIDAMDGWLSNHVTPCMQRKQQVGECWVSVILFSWL